jgi:hypothetical protein
MIILAVFVCGIVNEGRAQADDGWSLNPFSKSKESTAESSETKSSWVPSMPKLKNPFSSKSSTAKKKPSAWSKMSKTTKNWWNKTTDLLDPFPDDPAISTTEEEPSDGWLAGWFKPKPKEKYEDANEWLRQSRP